MTRLGVTATADGWVEWPFVPCDVDYTADEAYIVVVQQALWEARRRLLLRVSLVDRQTANTAFQLTYVDIEVAQQARQAAVDWVTDMLRQTLQAPAAARLRTARQQVHRLASPAACPTFWLRVLQATSVAQLRTLLQVSWQPDPVAALELYDADPGAPVALERRRSLLAAFDRAVDAEPAEPFRAPPVWLVDVAQLRRVPVVASAEELYASAEVRPAPTLSAIWVSGVVQRRRRLSDVEGLG